MKVKTRERTKHFQLFPATPCMQCNRRRGGVRLITRRNEQSSLFPSTPYFQYFLLGIILIFLYLRYLVSNEIQYESWRHEFSWKPRISYVLLAALANKPSITRVLRLTVSWLRLTVRQRRWIRPGLRIYERKWITMNIRCELECK